MSLVRENALRRSAPRIYDTDWLLLRGLRARIEQSFDGSVRKGAFAIDLGCGTSPYRHLFESHGVIYRGADLGSGADIVIRENGTVIADDGCADLVLSFQVLEHVRDVAHYLAECRRLLAPNGRLILSTHGSWLYHPHPEDHRRWTREGLLAELEASGFVSEKCHSLVGPLAWTTMLRLTGYAYIFRKVPIFGSYFAGVLASIMNVRAWAEDKITPARIRDDNACVYFVVARATGF